MDAATRSRLLSLARIQPRAGAGVTGVTGVTGFAGRAASDALHLPLHLEPTGKAQSEQGVTPGTPCNTLEWSGEREQELARSDDPEAKGVTAAVTPVWTFVDAEDWQAAYDERAAVREFDGGLPRAEAERLAYADTVADLGEPPPGVQLSPPSAAVIVFDPGRRRGA